MPTIEIKVIKYFSRDSDLQREPNKSSIGHEIGERNVSTIERFLFFFFFQTQFSRSGLVKLIEHGTTDNFNRGSPSYVWNWGGNSFINESHSRYFLSHSRKFYFVHPRSKMRKIRVRISSRIMRKLIARKLSRVYSSPNQV